MLPRAVRPLNLLLSRTNLSSSHQVPLMEIVARFLTLLVLMPMAIGQLSSTRNTTLIEYIFKIVSADPILPTP